MEQKDEPLVTMSANDREKVWDEVYATEEGIVEFDGTKKSGKIRSPSDGNLYVIDSRELVRTKIELHKSDKVLFAPFEGPGGDDYARVIRIIELNA